MPRRVQRIIRRSSIQILVFRIARQAANLVQEIQSRSNSQKMARLPPFATANFLTCQIRMSCIAMIELHPKTLMNSQRRIAEAFLWIFHSKNSSDR